MTKHKCCDCDRQIPAHIPCCIFCKTKYRKAGTCWWCRMRPVKTRQKGGPQSQYCVHCQELDKGFRLTKVKERTLSSRGVESRGRSARSPQQMAHLMDE